MSKKIIKVPIKGMHCRSCELLIEEKIRPIKRVVDVKVDHMKGEAEIFYKENSPAPDMKSIKEAVVEAGYEIGVAEELPFITRNKQEYINLGIAFLVLMIIYLILKTTGLTDINLNPSTGNPGWGLMILIGLVAGFSTCMALIGGLLLGVSAKYAESHPEATPAQKFRPHIFFVIGRVLSYAFFGGLLGLLGTAFKVSSTMNGIITIAVGGVMLLMGLQLINIFPRLNKVKITLPKGVARKLGINQKDGEYSHRNSILMGAMTFFLPCGFTQAMQLYAISTGNFFAGAMTMGLFALGTAPGLLSIGGVTSVVQGKFKERFFKTAGLAVLFFGLFNVSNGYSLASMSFGGYSSGEGRAAVINDKNVKLENGVQVVRMIEGTAGYSPNAFSIKKGVPVKWIINAQNPYSCASSIILPKLGISKNLEAGENIIEFTPEETGRLPFSCSMGMYKGVFNVYDGDGGLGNAQGESKDETLADDSADNYTAPTQAAPVPSGSSSCTMGGCGCGGGAQNVTKDTEDTQAKVEDGVQTINSTYTSSKYLSPNSFRVKAGKTVKFTIDVKDDGRGCGYAITVPGLYDNIVPLVGGKKIVMQFKPTAPGKYDITCGMGMIRFGTIVVE